MRLLPLLALIVALLPLAARADRTLIVTANTGRIHYPTATGREDAAAALDSKLDELRKAHPDAILLDLGGSMTPRTFTESSYGITAVRQLVTRHQFDAVHLTAPDIVFAGSRSRGLASIPDADVRERFFSRIGIATDSADQRLQLPTRRTIRRGTDTTEIASLADPARASAWRGAEKRFSETPVDEILAPGEGMPFRAVVTDMDFAVVERIARSQRRPDLIFSLSGPQDGTVRANDGASTIVQGPAPGNVLLVTVDAGGKVAASQHQFLAAERLAELAQVPISAIGVGISNATDALGRALSVSPGTVQADRFDATAHADLTRRAQVESADREPTVYCFRGTMEGKPVRVYRVQMLMPVGSLTQEPTVVTAWPRADFLVALGEDGKVARIAFRDAPKVLGYTFDMKAAIEAMTGSAGPSDLPYPQYAGAEDFLRAFAENVRRVIELDRRLYADSTRKP
jgi:hypothetical protein